MSEASKLYSGSTWVQLYNLLPQLNPLVLKEEDNQIHRRSSKVFAVSGPLMYCSVYRLPVDTPLCCSLDKGQSRLLKATSSDLRVAVDVALLDAPHGKVFIFLLLALHDLT